MTPPHDSSTSLPPGERRSPVVTLLLGFFVLSVVAFSVADQRQPSLDFWSDIAHLPFPMLGLVLFVQATFASRDGGVRRGWYLLAAGQLIAVVGDVTWIVAGVIDVDVATAPYVLWIAAYAGFTVAGMVRLMRAAPSERQRRGDWVDAGVMIAAGCVLAWYLVVQQTARLETGQIETLALYFLTTSANFGLLYVAAALWLRNPAGIPRRTAAWFVAGFAVYVAADLLYERATTLATYHGGSYIDALYDVASLCLALGADAYRRRPALAMARDEWPRRTDVIPVAATVVALVPLLLQSRHVDRVHTPLFGIAVGLAVLLLMVLWRQRLARSEIDALVLRRIGLEQQLWQAQKMEAIGRLAGGIAHDFNNILAAISSHAQLLRTADGRPAGHELEEIEYATQRAATLTRRLLAFSRADSPGRAAVGMSHVVRSMDPILRRLLDAPLRMEVELADDNASVLLADGQLEQVLLNLVVNARDAMPDGGTLRIATRRVRVREGDALAQRGVAPGEWAVLEVRDTGTGMDDQVQARMFEPFFTTKPRGHGTGLGMVTVAGIVDAARGRVLVQSAPAQGTTVTVVFPIAADPAPLSAGAVAPVAPPRSVEGATVLIVDDEASVRRALGIYLSRNQFTVLEAEHGRAALALLEQRAWRVDLVITDVEMPGLNGIELAREVRRHDPSLPLLFMSGFVDGRRDGGDRAPELPPAAVLMKPFELGYLLDRVRAALRGEPAANG